MQTPQLTCVETCTGKQKLASCWPHGFGFELASCNVFQQDFWQLVQFLELFIWCNNPNLNLSQNGDSKNAGVWSSFFGQQSVSVERSHLCTLHAQNFGILHLRCELFASFIAKQLMKTKHLSHDDWFCQIEPSREEDCSCCSFECNLQERVWQWSKRSHKASKMSFGIGCIADNTQTHSATRTCLTNTRRDAEPFWTLKWFCNSEVDWSHSFSNLTFVVNNVGFAGTSQMEMVRRWVASPNACVHRHRPLNECLAHLFCGWHTS